MTLALAWPTDPSVWIALATGVFALLTLVYNGWSQRRDKKLARRWEVEDRQALAAEVAQKVEVSAGEAATIASASAARIAASLADQQAVAQQQLLTKSREHVAQVAEAATAEGRRVAAVVLEAEERASAARKLLATRLEEVRTDLAQNSATTTDVAAKLAANIEAIATIQTRQAGIDARQQDLDRKLSEAEIANIRLVLFQHQLAKTLAAEGEAHQREAERIKAELTTMLPPDPALTEKLIDPTR